MEHLSASETQAQPRPNEQRRIVGLAGLGLIVALSASVLLLMLGVRDRAEAAMAGVAAFLPVGYAFGAGMVASVNPCGFLLLPSYVSYQLGTPGADESFAFGRLLKGLVFASLATGGFVVISSVVGTIVSLGGEWLIGVFPYAGMAIGVVMASAGMWLLLTNKTIGIVAAGRVSLGSGRALGSGFLFGVTYAISSLACTLPVFLVVVGSALATEGVLSSLGQFVGYALGMGVVILGVTMATAFCRSVVTGWLRGITRHVHRISAMFLLGAGIYLVYYWGRSLQFLI